MAIRLFEPIELRSLTLPNRIVVEPMTQFSADDGVAGDWHIMHLGQFAVSGAGQTLAPVEGGGFDPGPDPPRRESGGFDPGLNASRRERASGTGDGEGPFASAPVRADDGRR